MDWNKFLTDLMFVMITAVLPILARYLIVFINTKVAEKTANIESENIKKYINAATEAVSLAVLTVQQTYTDSMKASGKFDKEAAIKAKNMALEKAKSIITDETKKYVEMLYGDFESWIDQAIETMVRDSKIKMVDEKEYAIPEIEIGNAMESVPVTE